MIHLLESALRRARRALSRDEWSWRLLRLPLPPPDHGRRGLLLIQIDGLSHGQLDKAMRSGRMPFLRDLLNKEGYRKHSLYSGLPSTTPAAQGEFFYGRPCCVPAFAFRDGKDGRVMTMLNPESAMRVEKELAETLDKGAENETGRGGEPLLAGGSAYSNIYTGGADEAHFCASRLRPWDVLRSANPLVLAIILVWNAPSVLRLFGLLGVEAALALYDAIRGSLSRGEWGSELKFLFSRVLVCVGLREVVTAMASMDLMRGLPVVQLNFPGYDEQSHRRGPSSAFAHFSLRGIDRCVKRLYQAAHRSHHRDYEVWVYSDHGQEEALPYLREKGRTLEAAVNKALAMGFTQALLGEPGPKLKGAGPTRVVRSQDAIGARMENSLMGRGKSETASDHPPGSTVVLAYGPVGHIYLPKPCPAESWAGLATVLRREAGIPMVLGPLSEGRAIAHTAAGVFTLPQDAAAVLGADHPFLDTCARDLAKLCHHGNAGDFIALGWRPKGKPITFAWENGAHGGPGKEETHAFALLPNRVKTMPGKEPLRHATLRELALRVKHGRAEAGEVAGAFKPSDPEARLRVLSYNAHACEGMDGKTSPSRIARVIAQTHADIIALQECYGPERGDLTAKVAMALEQEFHFDPLTVAQDSYGNALLTSLPMRLIRQGPLPTVTGFTLEERGAQWAEIEWQGLPLQILHTHLGLLGQERQLQAEALIGEAWLQPALAAGPALLLGDFNAGPLSSPYRIISRHLADVQGGLEGHKPRNTFFSRIPVHRIDHVFLSSALRACHAEVSRTHLTRLASDHLPLLVEIMAA